MNGMKIKEIHARQIVDCKCRPMVEADVITENGCMGRGCAPTGLSVGMYESFVLRDNHPSEYHGLAVHKAANIVNHIIAPALKGMDVTGQEAIDRKMISLDDTEDKHRLGGNSIYSVSIACIRAAAQCAGLPLYEYLAKGPIHTVPVPSFNVINGGRYETLTQPFNEFIIMPWGASDIYQAVEMGIRIFQELQGVLTRYLGHSPEIAPSYGYAAPSQDPQVVLELMAEAVSICGYQRQTAFALDCASSEMYDTDTQTYYLNGNRVSSREIISCAKALTEKYPFVFIEDLLDENDWDGFVMAKQLLKRTNILGDDFIVTNRGRLEKAYASNAIDGFILKPNQVGTITEALETYSFAREHGLIAVPSGRSGGVIGDVVMDLAVGLEVGFIKNGAPRSGERIDKLNFLMRACETTSSCRLADISGLLKF